MRKNEFKKLAQTVKPSSFLDYKDYLRSLYLHLKHSIAGYTWPRLGQDLGFSATNVIQHIVKGRRPLTTKSAEKIVKALELRGVERRYLLSLTLYCNARTAAEREQAFDELLQLKEQVLPTQMSKDLLEYYSDWHYVIIGELARIKGFSSDPEWIANNLEPSIKPDQVKKCLEFLQYLGVLRWDDEQARWIRTERNPSTGHEVPGQAVSRYHQKMIEHGRDAVMRVPREERDISTMTLSLTEEKFRKIKMMIHNFQMQVMMEEEGDKDGERIYQLNLQLFPFSKKPSA